jgi:hypothetical protein
MNSNDEPLAGSTSFQDLHPEIQRRSANLPPPVSSRGKVSYLHHLLTRQETHHVSRNCRSMAMKLICALISAPILRSAFASSNVPHLPIYSNKVPTITSFERKKVDLEVNF